MDIADREPVPIKVFDRIYEPNTGFQLGMNMMPVTDPVELRQSNGYVGERRTDGILAKHFYVLKSSVDRDGADLLIDIPSRNIEEYRDRAASINVFGIIQAKFFEAGTTVYIDPQYAANEAGPRENFFLFLHTDTDAGEHARYFLTADEVLQLPTGSNGKKRFSLTQDDLKLEYKTRTVKQIVELITRGIETSTSRAITNYTNALLLDLRMRTAQSRNKDYEYNLINVSLPSIGDPNLICDAKAVFARLPNDNVARPIDARWDLQQGGGWGTFAWGRMGSGTNLLASSILGHYFGPDTLPSIEQRDALIYHLSRLDPDRDHQIRGWDIENIIV